jgi:hypothetical protein
MFPYLVQNATLGPMTDAQGNALAILFSSTASASNTVVQTNATVTVVAAAGGQGQGVSWADQLNNAGSAVVSIGDASATVLNGNRGADVYLLLPYTATMK